MQLEGANVIAEKRRRPRVMCAVRVDYPDASGITDWTENLSAQGVFVRTQRPFARGEVVSMRLTFPTTGEVLELDATVVWIREAGVRGVGARVDSPKQRKRLADILLQETADMNGSGPYRVFIAEDNPNLLDVIKRSLEGMAAAKNKAVIFSYFPNGHAALTAASKSLPDLLLADINMPVLDGLTLIRRIRAHPDGARVAVLGMGASADTEQEQAIKAGADGFLTKPFNVAVMTGLVTDLLMGRHEEASEAPADVLLLDDEIDSLELLTRTLRGFRTAAFQDPHQALEVALRTRPKVLVIDYKMPALDGVAFLEQLRKGGESRCSAIMVTAYPELDEVVFARQTQLFYRLVPKPIEPAILREQVRLALEEYGRKDEALQRFLELSGSGAD